ncbi:MAG TPA: F0F1 ATP synthase subunit A [Candidatus Paceibacterota bacterium]
MEPSGLHIALAAEKVGTIFGLPITNTLVTAWTVMIVLITIAFFAGRNPQLIPGKLQSAFEGLIDFVLSFMEQTLGTRESAIRYFPLVATLFIFIAASNLFDFMPFVGSIVVHHGNETIPLFRAANTDLNMTLALAIIAVIAIEVIGIATLGFFKYSSKFFNLHSPISFTVGIIEFVSEMSRFVSFSFRLFGNIFAGEVLLAVASYFIPYFLPIPLMAFETFVGIVQGAVFAMLTLFFIKLAMVEAKH